MTPPPAAARIDHALITRFNLPSAGAESLIRAEEGWLRNRIELFERYCAPSVRAQTTRAFEWIIYLDPESPDWLLDRLRPLEAERLCHLLFRTEVLPPGLLDDVRDLFPEPGDLLLTTNLDNDDSIATDFIERLQTGRAAGDRRALYLANGLIRSEGELYGRTDRQNAFCSVVEPWDGALTCWIDWHNRLSRHMTAEVLGGAPAWLQVVHGRNVSNRVRGRLVAPARFEALFPGLLDDLAAPGFAALAVDRLVKVPARALREAVRSAGKRAVMAVGGKQALDRFKARRAEGHMQ